MRKKATRTSSQPSASAALRESEERWKFALEGAGEGVWDWDVPGHTVVFSKRWKEMLGFEEDEIGNAFEEWERRVHPEDLPGALGVVQDHLAGKTPAYANEFRMQCKDGSWKWILARGMVTSRDGDGHALRVIGTHTDISAGRAAKEREVANLRLIVEDAPLAAVLQAIVCSVEAEHPAMCCGVMQIHPAGDRLAVGAAPRLPDYFKRAVEGMTIGPVAACCGAAVHARQRVIVPDIRLDARWEPYRKVAARAGLVACWAEPIVGHSGRVRGAFVCYHREPHTPNAAETAAITSAAQLAALAIEREERKELLRQSESRYRQIVNTAEEGILTIDARAQIDFVNPKMAHMLGYTIGDMMGRPLGDFLDDEGRAILAEKVKLRQQGVAEQFEFRFPHRDGSDLWTLISTNPITDASGAYAGALGMFTDITKRKNAEAALRASEERYARAMRGTSEGLWDWNIATGEDYLSPRWKEMLGFVDEELPNHEDTFFSRIHPDDASRVEAAVKAHLEQRAPYDIEMRLRTKDGGYRWVRSRGEAERDAHGRPVRMAGSISDITQRKEAEAALRESEERFRAIFEQAAVGVAVIDSNTGRFLSVNQRACDIACLTPGQMTAATFMDITHPEDLQPDLDNMEKLKAGIIPTFTMEKRYLHPDGTITWINLTVSPMWQPGEAPTRHIAVVEDITLRKEAEAALRESEQRFRAIFEQAAVGVAVIDSNTGRFLSVNQRHCDITRLTREQVLAAAFMDITHPDDWGTDVDNMAKLRAGIVRTLAVEKRYLHPDGAITWVNVTVSPLWRPGEAPTHHIAVVEDITERKRLEKELVDVGEREQQRIGHELHDDLCQRLASTKLKFEMIIAAVERGELPDAAYARQLFNQLAEATRVARNIAKGLSPLDPESDGLMNALSTLVPNLESLYDVPCFFQCPEPVLVKHQTSAAHLYRIAQELVNNAARHARPTRIEVRLEKNAEHVRIEVENDGVSFLEPARPGPGMGLRILHFRASAIGASVQFRARPDGRPGTLAVCIAPQSSCNPGVVQRG